MKVVDGAGRAYRVGRRWLPWRRRVKNIDAGVDLGGVPTGDDPLSLIVLVISLAIAVPVVLVFLLSVSELLLLVLLLPLWRLGRVLLRRPWTVDVTSGRELVATYQAPDWPASGALVSALAAAIQSGRPWPPEGRLDPTL